MTWTTWKNIRYSAKCPL